MTFDPDAEVKLLIDSSQAVHICQPQTGSSPEEDMFSRSSHRVYDARGEMKTLCEQRALSEMEKTSINISNEIVSETATKYGDIRK